MGHPEVGTAGELVLGIVAFAGPGTVVVDPEIVVVDLGTVEADPVVAPASAVVGPETAAVDPEIVVVGPGTVVPEEAGCIVEYSLQHFPAGC